MIYGILSVVECDNGDISFFAIKSVDYRRWKEIKAPVVTTHDPAKIKVIREFWHTDDTSPEFWVSVYLEGKYSGNIRTYRLD